MYDARGGSNGTGNNLGFALIVIAVVVGAFVAAFKGPDLLGGGSNSGASSVLSANASGELKLPGLDTDRLDAALLAYDPALHASVTRQLSGTNLAGLERVSEDIAREISVHIARDRATFAQMDMRYVDEIVNMTRDGLRSASRGKNRWCQGSSYAEFTNITSEAEITRLGNRLGRELGLANPAVAQYSLNVASILLEGGVDARHNPVRYDAMTPQDEAALQGAMFSLIADPQIMQLMMAGQTGRDPEEVLASIDVCSLANSLVSAARTLPEDTKGRLWAASIRGNGNFADLGSGMIGGY